MHTHDYNRMKHDARSNDSGSGSDTRQAAAHETDEDSGRNAPQGNAEKDPDTWTTGDESMTGAQASYLKTLSDEAGEIFDHGLTKAEASKAIDALQARTGRGRNH